MNYNNNFSRPLFIGGGYSGPSAAELERQAQRDFERQQELMREQQRLAEEERQRAEMEAKAKEMAAAAQKEMEDAARKAREQAAANDAAANAADVAYDPTSGSVMSFMRSGIQIPNSNDSSGTSQ